MDSTPVPLRTVYVELKWELAKMSERRELYRSPNGDTWYLGREPQNGHAFVIHQPNGPSGGQLSHVGLPARRKEWPRASGPSASDRDPR